MAYLIANKLFGFIAGIFALLISAGLPFLSEHISIGTLAEAFGTFIFFLFFYLLIEKKYITLGIVFLIGLLSHPFIGLIIGIGLITLFPFLLLHKDTKNHILKHKKIYLTVLILLICIIASLFVFENLRNIRLVNMFLSDNLIITGGKFYSLLDIIQRRSLMPYIYMLGLIGILLFIKRESRINRLLFAFLIIIQILLVFNHEIGIYIEPYRFIPYLEVSMAIFCAGALFYFSKTIKKISFKTQLVLIGFLATILIFNFHANINSVEAKISHYQKPGTLGMLPEDDKLIIEWLSANDVVGDDEYVCSLYKWGYWIPPLAKKRVLFSGYEQIDTNNNDGCGVVFNTDDLELIKQTSQTEKLKYIYYSSHTTPSDTIKDNFTLLFESNQAKIYQLY